MDWSHARLSTSSLAPATSRHPAAFLIANQTNHSAAPRRRPECQWGKVLAWEPPSRVLLAWQITPSFSYDPDLVTELDVRFTAEGRGTRVELEHRLDGYGAAAEQMFQIFDSPEGWTGLLENFAREAG
jgi:uncharacterized protein YndB with AHSA1/START domain